MNTKFGCFALYFTVLWLSLLVEKATCPKGKGPSRAPPRLRLPYTRMNNPSPPPLSHFPGPSGSPPPLSHIPGTKWASTAIKSCSWSKWAWAQFESPKGCSWSNTACTLLKSWSSCCWAKSAWARLKSWRGGLLFQVG
ncbi:hypothetical protein MTO96_017885 [Rhipicephalus appendiculatus]